ncbi:MAG: hypothetical protein Q8O76_08545 [Chloroflexota bacterium]|nr:hypothetical protein [Chloroflexota bacterium]
MVRETDLSFDLNEEMLERLGKEFDPQAVVDRFARAIDGKAARAVEKAGREVFGGYGRELMKRSIQLGEEYPDRTYDVLKKAAARSDVFRFPLFPQRALEIAYLSTQPIMNLRVLVNNLQQLSYRLDECVIFAALKEKSDEKVAGLMACRHACLAACDTAFAELTSVPFRTQMEASMAKEGYCRFTVRRQ